MFRKKKKKEMQSPVFYYSVQTDSYISAEWHNKPRNNLQGYQKGKR